MTYDIYFHNDFDGRASAALILAFLRNRGDAIAHFTAVDYDLTDRWLDERFFKTHRLFTGPRHPAIVVDFMYHPEAAMWFDHHPTTFKRPEWRSRYVRDAFHRLDPSYKSNCHLVYAALKENFGWRPPAYFKDLVKWVDIIDAAGYRSPRQIINVEGIGMEVAAYVDAIDGNPRATVALIKALAALPLAEVAALPKIQKIATATRRENMKSLAFYREHMRIDGDVSIIDLTATDLPSLRFAPYLLDKKVVYALRIMKKGRDYVVGVGVNPWISRARHAPFREVHIGEMMKKFGGGGHKGAGACQFKTKSDALRGAEAMIPLLNP
jgi:oligoribonuclease NrnB/cAMP/cGMP phosphodiesterase (DHH superfamily)